MNGRMNFSPGVRVRSYLPSFSTTQACCWGTILNVRKTKIAAMTRMTSAISMGGPCELGMNGRCGQQHEPVALDSGNDVFAGHRRCAGREPRGPARAAVADLCGAVGRPGGDMNALADV